MTILNPVLSRRTFLSGAGASIALTVAQSATCPLLPSAPLAVNALLLGANAFGALESVLASPHLDLRAVVVAHPYGAAGRATAGEQARELLSPAVNRLLARTDSKARVLELHQNHLHETSFAGELGLPTLLLGSFPDYWVIAATKIRADPHPTLMRILRASPVVYVDDPPLAHKIISIPALADLASCTVVGLCSPFDPAIDFALSHLRSNAIGQVTQISTSLRVRDAANRLEAGAIHQRLLKGSPPDQFPALHFKGVLSVDPVITLRGTRGHLQIALYNSSDRQAMLPVRLHHFASVARGDDKS